MRFQTQNPIPPLSEFIDSYWSIESNSNKSEQHTERVIPNGTSQIIFHYGTPFINQKDSIKEKQQKFILCGINKNASNVITVGDTGMIGVVFKPFGLKPFFNLPMNYLTGRETELSNIITKEAPVLEDRLLECKNFQQRVNIINAFLISNLFIKNKENLYIAKKSISLIQDSNGSIPINRIAEQLYLSPRTLERIFKSEIGTTPKFFMRLERFKNALKIKVNNNKIDITTLSYQSGYYDQSHFIKEFSLFSGMSPGRFFNSFFNS